MAVAKCEPEVDTEVAAIECSSLSASDQPWSGVSMIASRCSVFA